MKPARVGATLLLAAATAAAQYKVVGPDGKVTYTDRPGAATGAVSPVGRDAARGSAATPALPYELRQVAGRFPVTLYAAPDCGPCERGRRLLQQRGIPYTERLVRSDEDQAALERLTGARTVPVLAVGRQLSRGWLESEWSSNLDLAGYPQQSMLPRDWRAQPATPLVPTAETAAVAPAPAPAPRVEPPAVTPPAEPQGLRF